MVTSECSTSGEVFKASWLSLLMFSLIRLADTLTQSDLQEEKGLKIEVLYWH